MGDMVYATIDGKAVSWANAYTGAAPSAAPEVKNMAYAGSDSSSEAAATTAAAAASWAVLATMRQPAAAAAGPQGARAMLQLQ